MLVLAITGGKKMELIFRIVIVVAVAAIEVTQAIVNNGKKK
jgi:hypothetical protein